MVSASFRQFYAADIAVGMAPIVGESFGPQLLSQKINRPLYWPLKQFIEMTQNCLDVVSRASVKDRFLYGVQRRNPVTDSPTVIIPADGKTMTTNLVGQQDQPYVYAMAWQLDQTVQGALFGQLGVLLMNWTDATDVNLPSLGMGVVWEIANPPGDQLVAVTIDPVKYDLQLRPYQVLIYKGGVAGFTQASVDFSSGQPVTLRVAVDARNSAFLTFD